MSQHDVLNPSPWFDQSIQDSMNPNFGFTRKRASTRSLQKAVGGIPYTRDLGNTGHTLTLSWLGRSLACVERLKLFYEQFEDGYFTIIDWDAQTAAVGAQPRHYVGRFTTEISPIETGNGMYDVQNAQFEEIPQCPMLMYPGNWAQDAVDVYPFNDFGDQKLATQGTWSYTARQIGGVARTTADDAGDAGDWAQHEYHGYGFQLWCLVGPGQGMVQVLLDGAIVATVGLSSSSPLLTPQMVFSMQNVSLDLHRVQIVVLAAEFVPTGGGSNEAIQTWAAGAAPAAWSMPSTPGGYTPQALPCSWVKLRVMR